MTGLGLLLLVGSRNSLHVGHAVPLHLGDLEAPAAAIKAIPDGRDALQAEHDEAAQCLDLILVFVWQ
jgi:hypothetical protein